MNSLISEWYHAILQWVSPNEAGLDQKFGPETGEPTWDDPVKIRFGAYRPFGRRKFYFGTISMDLLFPPQPGNARPHQEKGFLAFKMDSNDDDPVARPCIEAHLQRDEHTHEDDDMLCAVRISSKGLEIDPKQKGGMGIFVGGQPLGGANPRRIYFEALPNGVVPFVEIRQRDGHVTLHRIADEQGYAIPEEQWGDGSNGRLNTIVWTNWHGNVQPPPWNFPGWGV